ncbi:hypothetical protein DV736_g6641, partial [Chaetothyriales sp. CBS 134916]
MVHIHPEAGLICQNLGISDPTENDTVLWNRQYEMYKVRRQDYLKREEKLQAYAELILATVGPNFTGYLKDKVTPHEILQELQGVAKPSDATLRKMVKDEMSRRDQGPKRQSVEA